jgi:hypothetical protein
MFGKSIVKAIIVFSYVEKSISGNSRNKSILQKKIPEARLSLANHQSNFIRQFIMV